MRQQGLVSVVTATYNMENYIAETLDSILAQDYPHIESIVIDDGSTDNTAEILARYASDPRVRVVHQRNAGQTVAKNRGIAEARGEFVAFCDADDTWQPRKLSRQIPRFADPKVAVVFSDITCIDGQGRDLGYKTMPKVGGHITGPLLIDNFVHFPTTVVRAEVLKEMNGFDENLTMSIDYDLWLRISLKYEFAFVDEKLANYRIWAGQMSKKEGERLDNYFRLLERFLAAHPGAISRREADLAWAHVYVTRGNWHKRSGRRGEAIRDFRRSFALKPFDRRLGVSIVNLILRR